METLKQVLQQTTKCKSLEDAEMSLAGQEAMPNFLHGHIEIINRKDAPFKVICVFESPEVENKPISQCRLFKGQKIVLVSV